MAHPSFVSGASINPRGTRLPLLAAGAVPWAVRLSLLQETHSPSTPYGNRCAENDGRDDAQHASQDASKQLNIRRK